VSALQEVYKLLAGWSVCAICIYLGRSWVQTSAPHLVPLANAALAGVLASMALMTCIMLPVLHHPGGLGIP
jgi:hypothetical protein